MKGAEKCGLFTGLVWFFVLSCCACGCSQQSSTPGKDEQQAPVGKKPDQPAKAGPTAPAAPGKSAAPAAPAAPETGKAPRGEQKSASWLDRGGDETDDSPLVEPDEEMAAEQRASLKKAAARVRAGKKSRLKPPPRACAPVYEQPVRIWPGPAPIALTAVGDRFVAAGYRQQDEVERVFVVRISPGSLPLPLTTLRLKKPLRAERWEPPGIDVRDASRVTLAVIDGDGVVLAGAVPVDGPSAAAALHRIGREADRRFSPAVSHVRGLPAVAWSVGTTPMRTLLALLDASGRVRELHDVTPQAMGATAPAFVQGLTPPVLLAVDAHEGFSPLLRIALGPDGTPAPARVAVTVGLIATPVELAAAAADFATLVAYTAIGNAATSAVGIVPVDPEGGQVQALVPGTSYGRLHTAAASTPRALLFAADAPKQKGEKGEREIQLRIVDAKGMGPITTIQGPDGTASDVALARAKDGTVAVGFSDGSGVYVHFWRCDDH